MNEFYDIASESIIPEGDFRLRNLGNKTAMAIIGTSVRYGWERGYDSKTLYRDTKPEDYDGLFVSKLLGCKPIYDLSKILDYHLNYFTQKVNGDKDKFLKHIKYEILPSIKKKKNKEVVVDLIETWLKSMASKKRKVSASLKIGNINAPVQLLVNSDNANQNQNINYNSEDIRELLSILKLDIKNIETSLRKEFKDEIKKTLEQLDKNKDVKGRLLTIGGMIKDVGVGVFTNLVSSPTYDLLKPFLGLS